MRPFNRIHDTLNHQGMTLVELMIALVVSAIILSLVYVAFLSQHKTYIVQDSVAETQQNIRSAMMAMAREVMLIGYDPKDTGRFGIVALSSAQPGNALTFTADFNGNGLLDADETITYSLFDSPVTPVSERDGMLDLVRDNGATRELVAESIIAMSIAYAVDEDNDGVLDVNGTPGQTIWAIDKDNDGRLDTYLDTNNDGSIDAQDAVGGASLGRTINTAAIRAAKIWLLASARTPRNSISDSQVYVVGQQHIGPSEYLPTNRHRLLVTTVFCRNM